MADITFAGGGIGGLVAAILSHRSGLNCQILEQTPKYKVKGSGISIMSNALLALKEYNLQEAFQDVSCPMNVFQVRDDRDQIIFQTDFKKLSNEVGAPSLCLHRSDLLNVLLELAQGIPFSLDTRVTDFSVHDEGVRAEAVVNGITKNFESKILIGSDGIRSAVRDILEKKYPLLRPHETPLRPAGFTAWLGTIPFSSPKFKPGSVIHYWGRGKRVGLIDIGKGRLYWWITMNHRQVNKSLSTSAEKLGMLKDEFKNWPNLVIDALMQTPNNHEVIQVETADRVPTSFWGTGPVTLLGDAAHPSLTSLGQGAGLAIEDAVVLINSLKANTSSSGLRSYEKARQIRTSKLVSLSRRVATYEQYENSLAVKMRNFVFRSLPESLMDSQTRSMMKFNSRKSS